LLSVLPLEIQLSGGEDWDPINWLKAATLLYLPHARTWIFNVKYRVVILMFNDLMRDVIVWFLAIGRIVDHHCFNFVFHN
jgi:hypothetical protein